MRRIRALVFWLCIFDAGGMPAQDNAPVTILGVTVRGVLRGRVENWHWFSAPPAESSYTYESGVLRLGVGQSRKRWGWEVEGSFPVFVNVPERAVAPDPQGPLGYGGDYFLANGRKNIAAAVLRQAFVTVRADGERLQVRAGRFEFADGAEATPPDPELAALKRDRISQRLIGAYSYALRSFDGIEVKYDAGRSQWTGMAARAVEGSFRLRALQEIDVELGYGSYTRYFGGGKARSEVRAFGVYYRDGRGTPKPDNRPRGVTEADRGTIRLATPGGHFLREVDAGPGTVDVVLWAAGQFGKWGAQRHLAGEVAAEAGYRFAGRLRPWIRGGYCRTTGDPDPGDARHNTFFPILSNPRAYARLPFYVMMNVEDVMLQFRATPSAKWALRSEIHSVRLGNDRDLWYDGGGAFEAGSAGYLARPGGGRRNVGTSLDWSAEYTPSRNTTVSFYAGVGAGGGVPANVYPEAGRGAVVRLLSIEATRRF